MDRPLLLDVATLVALSAALGMATLTLTPAMPWVAEPPDTDQATCSAGEPVEDQLARISATELASLQGRPGVAIVDARGWDEYTAGHIPGAFNLPAVDAAGVLEVQSVPLSPDDLVVTYCDGAAACDLSEYLGILLRDRANCERVRVLAGGWAAWVASGGAVEMAERSDPDEGLYSADPALDRARSKLPPAHGTQDGTRGD